MVKKDLRIITRNYGDIMEMKDKVVCYVQQRNIKHDREVLDCSSKFNKIYGRYELELPKLHSDKKTTYVFYNINFDTGIKLVSNVFPSALAPKSKTFKDTYSSYIDILSSV